MNLPCEECVKTSNHCCKTDIRLSIPEMIIMVELAVELKKDFVFGSIPGSDTEFLILPNEPGLDITTTDCIFLGSDGKCEIYEQRPYVCRAYGTKDLRCRYECSNISTKEEIEKLTKNDIRMLDKIAFDNSNQVFEKYGDKLVKF